MSDSPVAILTPIAPTRLPRALPLACAAVAVATFLVFLPSLSNGWVMWDDDMNFLSNPAYRGLSPANLRWMFTTFHGGPYQPLSWLTLAVDYLIWGHGRPFGYHLTNVLLHAATAWMFTRVAAQLAFIRTGRAKSVMAFAVFAGICWAVHPLRVEAVSWITERREVLCGLLSLAAISSHLSNRGRLRVFAWSLLAMLAKGSAVTLPVMLLLIDLYRAAPRGMTDIISITLRSLWRHAAIIALAVGISAMAVVGQREAAALITLEKVPIRSRLDIMSNGLAFYAMRTVWPADLAPLYEVPRVVPDLHPAGIASAAGMGIAIALAFLRRRRTAAPLLLIAAYFVMVLPVGGLVQVGSQIAADRYAYQPGWALTLLVAVVAWGILRPLAQSRRPIGMLILALVAATALIPPCLRLQQIWHDTFALWHYELDVYPDTAIAHYNLAVEMTIAAPGPESDKKAEPHFRRAIAKLPHYSDAHREMAEMFIRRGQPDKAAEHYRTALHYSPRYEPARLGLAILLWKRGDHDTALAELHKLVDLSRAPATPRVWLAKALAANGESAAAIKEYEAALAEQPHHLEALTNLARLFATNPRRSARDGKRAVQLATQALSMQPANRSEIEQVLAAAYAETDAFDLAIKTLQKLAAVSPADQLPAIDSQIAQYQAGRPPRVEPRFP